MMQSMLIEMIDDNGDGDGSRYNISSYLQFVAK